MTKSNKGRKKSAEPASDRDKQFLAAIKKAGFTVNATTRIERSEFFASASTTTVLLSEKDPLDKLFDKEIPHGTRFDLPSGLINPAADLIQIGFDPEKEYRRRIGIYEKRAMDAIEQTGPDTQRYADAEKVVLLVRETRDLLDQGSSGSLVAFSVDRLKEAWARFSSRHHEANATAGRRSREAREKGRLASQDSRARNTSALHSLVCDEYERLLRDHPSREITGILASKTYSTVEQSKQFSTSQIRRITTHLRNK